MTLRRIATVVLVWLVAFTVVSCQSTPSTESVVDTAIATYRDGAVTVAELDRVLAATATDVVWEIDLDEPDQLEALVRRIAVDEIILARAQVDDEQIERRLREIKRRAAARVTLERLPPAPEIDRDDLEAYFGAERERFDRPERRRVLHIFRRYDADRDRKAVREELEALRQRVLDGENFGLLAREHSDSETRHNQGVLGEVTEGQYSNDLDSVIFSLEEAVPSAPIFTADGGHLFFVSDVFPARELELDEVGPMILRELMLVQREERLRDEALRLLGERGEEPLPDSYFDELLESTSPPPPVLFRVGEVEFRLDEFGRLGQQATRRGSNDDFARRLLRETYYQEILLQYGVAPEALDNEEIQQERDRVVIELFLDQTLRNRIADDTARLEAHYERNVGRFSEPVRVSITRARFPIEGIDSSDMARLEAARSRLDAGTSTLEELAGSNGGVIETRERQSISQLRAQGPRAVQFAFALAPGQHSPPFSFDGAILLFRLDDRFDAEPRPFETVRREVLDDYLSLSSQELYREFRDELLADNGFRLDRDALAQSARLLARLE
ncbi:MAG: peptidyl-prolyl cis-trans isomerase [Acidobacteriota bacterium]